MTDKALVEQILAGEKQAFATFVERYKKLVAHVVYRMVKNETDREDVCQDVFVRIYRNLSGFQFQSRLSTWVARISFNTAINHLEKKKVDLFDDISAEHEQLEDRPSGKRLPDDAMVATDMGERVRLEIDKLPILYGTIVALYHLEDMSYKEIADIMNMPSGTVKSHLFRGRKLLRTRLEALYSSEDLCS